MSKRYSLATWNLPGINCVFRSTVLLLVVNLHEDNWNTQKIAFDIIENVNNGLQNRIYKHIQWILLSYWVTICIMGCKQNPRRVWSLLYIVDRSHPVWDFVHKTANKKVSKLLFFVFGQLRVSRQWRVRVYELPSLIFMYVKWVWHKWHHPCTMFLFFYPSSEGSVPTEQKRHHIFCHQARPYRLLIN